MKKFITAIAIVAGATLSYGQECSTQTEPNYNGDEAGCRQAISLYTEFLKQENFNDAIKEWWPAQGICPQYKPVLYDNGVYLYKQAAKAITDKNSAEFKGKMDTLNVVYDLWIKNFGDCYEIQMQKAHDNMMDENKRYNVAYKSYEKAFETIPAEKVQSYDVVYFLRSAYFMLSGKLIDCEAMMTQYEKLNKIAEDKIKENQDAGNSGEVQNWQTAQATMESYITPCANCEQLLKIYKPQWEADKTNLELAKKISEKLGKLNCDDPIMMDMAVFIDAQEPSYKSKMALGNAFWSKGDYSKAKEYYDAAMEYPECTSDVKSGIWQKLGEHDLKKGNYKSAFKYGGMIGGCDGKYLQARAVAQSVGDCASNSTSRTALYSYALDLADAAGSCVSDSWKANLKGQLSTKAQLFSEGLAPGDSYDVQCWGVKAKLRVQ
jgi:tetratricopeptide (TPR) repeat protein